MKFPTHGTTARELSKFGLPFATICCKEMTRTEKEGEE